MIRTFHIPTHTLTHTPLQIHEPCAKGKIWESIPNQVGSGAWSIGNSRTGHKSNPDVGHKLFEWKCESI